MSTSSYFDYSTAKCVKEAMLNFIGNFELASMLFN